MNEYEVIIPVCVRVDAENAGGAKVFALEAVRAAGTWADDYVECVDGFSISTTFAPEIYLLSTAYPSARSTAGARLPYPWE